MALLREWGRIGSPGRVRLDLHADEGAALAAARRLDAGPSCAGGIAWQPSRQSGLYFPPFACHIRPMKVSVRLNVTLTEPQLVYLRAWEVLTASAISIGELLRRS